MQSCTLPAGSAIFVHERLDETAARLPDKTALITDEGTVSYAALAETTRRLAT